MLGPMTDEGTVEAPAGSRRAAAAGRVAAALLVLPIIWLFASEAWRVRWPGMLVAFVAVGWPLLVVAWRPIVPPSWRWSLGFAAVLIWADLLLDWWLETPSDRELASPEWEIARVAILVAVSFVLTRLPPVRWLRPLRAAIVSLSCAFVVLLAGLVLFIALAGPRDQARPADAALVLGREFFPDGSIRPELYARVDRAAALYRAGQVKHLVLTGASGGSRHPGPTEAGVMRELLVARGVPIEAMAVEIHARSTEENFACSMPILGELHARTVLVVTDPWHMPRAVYQGSRYAGDMELLAAPASQSPEWTGLRARSKHLVSEAVAYLFERVRRIHGSPSTCPP